jgi:hypothetical protein
MYTGLRYILHCTQVQTPAGAIYSYGGPCVPWQLSTWAQDPNVLYIWYTVLYVHAAILQTNKKVRG